MQRGEHSARRLATDPCGGCETAVRNDRIETYGSAFGQCLTMVMAILNDCFRSRWWLEEQRRSPRSLASRWAFLARFPPVTDDELTDAWEAGAVFAGGVSHWDHLRIAWVLHRRHPPDEAARRLLSGTKRACEVHGCPEKFDAALTARWAQAIAEAAGRDGLGPTPHHFFGSHPELRRGDLFSLGGSPALGQRKQEGRRG